MKTIILLILTAISSFALSNSIVWWDLSGTTQKHLQTIPRYFAQGEVCNYAAPYTGGTILTYWQSDVKTRWPADSGCAAGYVKFALITMEQTITASSSITIEFESSSSASSSGSGLNQAAMLAFNTGGGSGSWGAGWSATTGGVTESCLIGSTVPCDARAMIGAGMWKYLESGPLRTSVLVREAADDQNGDTTRTTSLGWQCTAGCTDPYSGATWSAGTGQYNSMRPSYVVTFYTSPAGGTNYVETDNIIDNGWMDRAQDQRLESFVVYTGAAETTACYTAPAAFVIETFGRVMETCWSSTQPAANVDFNLAYVTYSKAVPSYIGRTIGASAIALEVAAFNATDLGATAVTSRSDGLTPVAPHMGWAQYQTLDTGAGGTWPFYGVLSRWDSRYVASGFNSTLAPVVLGNAKGFMHAPIWFLENRTSSTYVSGVGSSANAFGRGVSIDVRPTLDFFGHATTGGGGDAPISPAGSTVNSSCTTPTCMVSCVTGDTGSVICNITAPDINGWGPDTAHLPEAFYTAYLFTGKYIYLEANWALTNWLLLGQNASAGSGGVPGANWDRWQKRGLVFSSGSPRIDAWDVRQLGFTASVSPDGTPEQLYFQKKLNNNLEAREGKFNITNGSFSPTGTSCTPDSACPVSTSCTGFNLSTETSIWRMVRCAYEGNVDWLHGSTRGFPNPLLFPAQGDQGLVTGVSTSVTGQATGPWFNGYYGSAFAFVTDLYPLALPSQTIISQHELHLIADSDFNQGYPAFASTLYRYGVSVPAINSQYDGYLQTWTAARSAIISSVTIAQAISAGATSVQFLGADNSQAGGPPSNNLNVNTWYDLPHYMKIDNEVFSATAGSTNFVSVSSVNTSLSQVTLSGTPSPAFVSGQLVRVYATSAVDNGMVGNSACKANTPDHAALVLNNNCDFYVSVVTTSPYVISFYNDSGLTSQVTLTGGSSGMWVGFSTYTVTPGQLNTTQASHSQGAQMSQYPVMMPGYFDSIDGNYGNVLLTSAAMAVDHDLTITDEGTGKIITARRAWDEMNVAYYGQANFGSNTASCGGGSVDTCDTPVWGMTPRPLVRNVRVISQATGNLTFFYTAPDGNTCSIGTSTSPFASTNDASDPTDSGGVLARGKTVTGLTSGTPYYYRISCGPLGNSARVSGVATPN